MGMALKVKHARNYSNITWLLLKHGRSNVVKSAGLKGLVEEYQSGEFEDALPEAASLAEDLEKMGPTYIKLGQLLSTRPDLLPSAYLEALTRLQDKVEPFSFAQVEQIVMAELGIRISKAFSEFEAEPIAAASLGQVHRARLRNGRDVAVKVQRPDIREKIFDDLDALCEVAEFLDTHTDAGRRYEFSAMISELRKSLIDELDYCQEARHLLAIRKNLADFERIIVPAPVEDYTTPRVLTMEYVRGKKITAVGALRQIELDGYELADQLFHAYLKQILGDGFFHADPHPGNVLLTNDDRIALLDLGMVARVTPHLQDRLLKLMLAISEGQAEAAAGMAARLCKKKEESDEQQFERRVADLVSRQQGTSLGQMDVGRTLLAVKTISADCGMTLPPEMTMIGKALLNLDQIGHTLAPEFDPNEAVRRHAPVIMRQRLGTSLSSGNFFGGLLEAKEALERLPSRVNAILEKVANNEIKVEVDAIDERTLIAGMQKIANRITMGLILAALIVGAALLMSVPTPFRILGYPGLAIIFFLLAGGGGLTLVANILLSDMRARKK